MDSTVLFSHGSLLCGAGGALLEHAARLRDSGITPIVEVGYLNYSLPTFAETVAGCIARGADRVVVAPYFLVPGYFVKVDLPRVVGEAKAAHPNTEFVVAAPIGFDPLLADALCESAADALPKSEWRRDLQNAAASCTLRRERPLYGAAVCRASGAAGASQEKGAGATIHADGASADQADISNRSIAEGMFSNQRDQAMPPAPEQSADFSDAALLVMVHGSPRPIANEEMFRVVNIIDCRATFRTVQVGFMECNSPDIPSAIAECVSSGASKVIAVPYFLHTGKHVADDLPTLIESAQETYRDVHFSMGAYLGRSNRITQILAERIRAVL